MKQNQYKRLCAVLSLVLTLSLAAGCAASESKPVVTSDDLTPFSTSILDTDGEQGGDVQPAVSVPEKKDYPYNWLPKDTETSLERLRQQLIAEHENDTEGFKDRQELEAWVDEKITNTRLEWENERALDPVVSPQEAANCAGALFETLYGIDLTNKTLNMLCYIHSFYNSGIARSMWRVSVRNDSVDGNYARIECHIDATTGEVIQVNWLVTNEECFQIRETPVPDCFIPIKVPSGWMRGGWDETHPNFAPTMQALIDEFTPLVSGSILTNGAAVTSVEYQLSDRGIKDETVNRLYFFVACDNGKTYLMERDEATQPYLEYDFGGYPLRAYNIYDTAYLDLP